jgi:hypothetical protein
MTITTKYPICSQCCSPCPSPVYTAYRERLNRTVAICSYRCIEQFRASFVGYLYQGKTMDEAWKLLECDEWCELLKDCFTR